MNYGQTTGQVLPRCLIYGKWVCTGASLLFAIVGAILNGLAISDSDACIDLRITSIFGTIYTGVGVILAALASLPV